jgi:uncharacterized membrane protein
VVKQTLLKASVQMANPLRRFAGDPTHPAVVHFPLALYPASLLFDILAYATKGGSLYTHGAFVLMLAATVMAVVAMATGFAQLPDIPPESPAWKLAILHMTVQTSAGCIFLVSLLLRLRHVDDAHPPTAAFVCAIIGVVTLFYGGWLGGHMVFSHGVSVEPQADIPAEHHAETEATQHTQLETPV